MSIFTAVAFILIMGLLAVALRTERPSLHGS
jgi:hypothetical protein